MAEDENRIGRFDEQLKTRPNIKPDRRDTAIQVTVCLQDRRSPHGTKMAQGILFVEEGAKVRTGNLGKCPHCRRGLPIRIVMERVD